MNVFVFDIETVPDVDGGRRLLDLDGLADAEVGEAMFQLRRQESDSDFLRLHLQRIVAISAVFRSNDMLKVWSLGDAQSSEQDLVRRFFDGIEKFLPTLVSWNGCSFDLPVLHYRALLHGVPAPRYWEAGDGDRDFRYNNYLSRYHYRHTDLMDVLAGYQPRAAARLDDIAILLGLPGKLGMDGAKVWQRFLKGEIHAIRNYCETDVLNTYLIYLRFELLRGNLGMQGYDRERLMLRDLLIRENKPHFQEFIAAWHYKNESTAT